MGTTIVGLSSYTPIVNEDIKKAPLWLRFLLLFQKPKSTIRVVEDTKRLRTTVTNYYKTFRGKHYNYISYCTIERKSRNVKNKWRHAW